MYNKWGIIFVKIKKDLARGAQLLQNGPELVKLVQVEVQLAQLCVRLEPEPLILRLLKLLPSKKQFKIGQRSSFFSQIVKNSLGFSPTLIIADFFFKKLKFCLLYSKNLFEKII
jgi:hypothetical protein